MKDIILHGNCLELLKNIPTETIDMVLTSPPYDDLRTYNGSLIWGEHIWKPMIKDLFRVLKKGGVVIWVVGDSTVKGSETGTSFKQALWAKDCGFNLHDTMIYQKDNPPPVGGSNRYYQHFEYMFCFSKGKPKCFNPIKTERRNKWGDKRTKRFKGFTRDKDGNFVKKWASLVGDVKIGNVWKYIVGGGNSVDYGTKHPATFPTKLAEDHILSWTNEGDIVLDCMAGSGTTGVAAKKLNRNYILMELVEEYYNICLERLDN
jgi:DNA modification methylase